VLLQQNVQKPDSDTESIHFVYATASIAKAGCASAIQDRRSILVFDPVKKSGPMSASAGISLTDHRSVWRT
jgi:hypothetical protein